MPVSCEPVACAAKNASWKGAIQNLLIMYSYVILMYSYVYELTYLCAGLKLCNCFGKICLVPMLISLQSIENWELI